MDSLSNNVGRMLRIFIFCILVHTATSAIHFSYQKLLDNQKLINDDSQSKETRYNQILSDLHHLFKERKEEDNDNSGDEIDEINYHGKKEEKKQLDEILAEITNALDKIKQEMIKFNNDGVLTVVVPDAKSEKRQKREVANPVENITSSEKNVTIPINVTTTEKPVTVTEEVEVLAVKNDTAEEENLNTEVLNKTEVVSSRRMLPMMAPQLPPPQFVTTTSRVKDKLLSYLEDTFNEVERKIKPLTNIKIALSNDDHYRIGYIIATIDTLEVNLKKLKNDLNLHQHVWDDEKILDLFDRIKATNTVATSLIESLKKYLPRN